MSFQFNLYSTPLLFGFVQGWIYALLFWNRALRNRRLSDGIFGVLLMAFTFEIWEYMLGFAGIEVLWKELDFFPRTFSLLIPALVWLYLKSQFNTHFLLEWKHLIHGVPYLLYLLYHVFVFSQGPNFVQWWKENFHLPFGVEYLEALLIVSLTLFYFFRASRLYQQYQNWTPTQFSNLEQWNFHWFRNFLIAYILSGTIGWSVTLIDIWFNLDFWHDWWDELFNAGLIYYLSITGYAQTQPRQLEFDPKPLSSEQTDKPKVERLNEKELHHWQKLLRQVMEHEKLYLEPELNLNDLARRLGTNASVLSNCINRAFDQNFNDFVNAYRVEAVKKLLSDPKAAHLSLLGIGLESGFNSKATFNRAFKKLTGLSPREFVVKQNH